MRALFFFFVLYSSVFSMEISKLFTLYQERQYQSVCDQGVKVLKMQKQNEQFISVYAFSCLYADKIDRLSLPIILLKNSKGARKNAAYFSTILLQKNLLITALENDENLRTLSLPQTDYILSKVFNLYAKGLYKKKNRTYVLVDQQDNRRIYKLKYIPDEKRPRIIIDEYYDTILTKQRIYY